MEEAEFVEAAMEILRTCSDGEGRREKSVAVEIFDDFLKFWDGNGNDKEESDDGRAIEVGRGDGLEGIYIEWDGIEGSVGFGSGVGRVPSGSV